MSTFQTKFSPDAEIKNFAIEEEVSYPLHSVNQHSTWVLPDQLHDGEGVPDQLLHGHPRAQSDEGWEKEEVKRRLKASDRFCPKNSRRHLLSCPRDNNWGVQGQGGGGFDTEGIRGGQHGVCNREVLKRRRSVRMSEIKNSQRGGGLVCELHAGGWGWGGPLSMWWSST